MKKLIFISLLFVFVISCKSSSSPVETKLDKKTEVSLKGNWVLSKVSYPGSEYFKITSFNVADSKCFEGSQWKFVSNNNSGEMILTAPPTLWKRSPALPVMTISLRPCSVRRSLSAKAPPSCPSART